MSGKVFKDTTIIDDVKERVKKAFKRYRKLHKGIARVNFMCCRGCVTDALVPIAKRILQLCLLTIAAFVKIFCHKPI